MTTRVAISPPKALMPSIDRWDWLVALGLTVLSLTLNGIGLSWALPSAERAPYYPTDMAWYDPPKSERFYQTPIYEPYHPDEGFLLDALSNMNPGALDFNPRFFNYPSLQIYATGALVQAGQLAGYLSAVNSKAFYVENPAEIGRVFLLGRWLAAMMSALAVGLLYLTVKTMWGERPLALLAALALALTPLWVRNAHFMLINNPATMWMVASALTAALAVRTQKGRWLLISAVLAGLAASTRYFSGAVVLLTLFAWWHQKERQWRTPLFLALAALVAFLAGSPYILVTPDQFLRDAFFEGGSKLGLPPLALLTSHLVFAQGNVLFLLTLVGLGVALWRVRSWQGQFVLLWLLAGLVQRLISDADFVRYLIPALPPLAVCAGLALDGVRRGIGRIAPLNPQLGWLALVLLLPTVGYTANMLVIFSGSDARTDAARWIQENISAETPIGQYENGIYFGAPPINAERYPIVPIRDLAPADYPDVLVWSDAYQAIMAELPDPATATVTFSQHPSPLWTWPAATVPHDWAYTYLDVYVRAP